MIPPAGASGAERLKRAAAERAVELVEDGMRLGLGTGSTARHVLEVIAERRWRGELGGIVGVPTSRATEARARELGIPLGGLDDLERLDLTLDGADEVDPDLDLIKGHGGALLWEKIVAAASERLVIVVDGTKLVERLGTRGPLPVEVVPFGWRTHLAPIRQLGAEARLRLDDADQPFRTDGGHYLLDCRFDGGIARVRDVDRALQARAGIVDTGLFLGMATAVVVAAEGGTEIRSRSPSP